MYAEANIAPVQVPPAFARVEGALFGLFWASGSPLNARGSRIKKRGNMQPFVRGAGRSMILLIVGLSILAGCHSDDQGEDQQSAIPGDAATYQLRGIVVSSDAAKGIVTIDTEAIPGLMGAMTMPYKLAQPGVATELHQGDHGSAR